ncbi:MAG: hypothetical protein R3C10_05240 [Pirellulales bacterium]
MQLDRTTISIRERRFADLLDLALRVVWTRPGPWLAMLAVGAIPCALFDAWWFHGAVVESVDDGQPPDQIFWYLPLLVWQIPVATAPLTLYLGQTLFSQEWSGRKLSRDFWQLLPQLMLLQVVVRGILVLFCVTIFVLYLVWPHLNEIILLERNPMIANPGHPMTTMKRNSIIHTQGSGALVGRWLYSCMVATLLVGALWFGSFWMRGLLLGDWTFDAWFYLVQFQAAVWLTVGYFTVVRFLGYLDLRIRNEGWEVELLLRAEANRMASRVS